MGRSRNSSSSDEKQTKRARHSESPETQKNLKTKKEKEDSRSKEPDKSERKKQSRRNRSKSMSRSQERTKYRSHKKRYRGSDKSDDEHEYQRYYGDDSEKTKKNSDRYWNKYPKKDDNQVGARYYDVAEKLKEKEDVGEKADTSDVQPRQRKTVDMLTSRTGGAYIPPAKLRMMQAEITDKTSAAYQRIAWEALKKSIHGCINKVNTSNIGIIARELFQENIVRGRGLFCKSIIQAQAASPTFTHVYSALIAVVNSRFPNIGELLLRRLVLQFKRGFKQNNKNTCITAASFIAHLVNQRVAHEIVALEILTLLVESPTDDSVEVAISFLKECGQKLTEVSNKGISAIFEMLRNILHEGQLEKRIQYMIEVMFQIRKDGFKDHAAIIAELDLIEEEEQFTHLITLDEVEPKNAEDILNVFKLDDNYEENEDKYKTLSKDLLASDASGSESGSEGSEEEAEEEGDKDSSMIIDNTETNLITLRRTIYLTIQSSLDFEECAHKLMKMELKPGQEIELCHMFLDCCAEQRTYEKFYGLLAQRFCQINKVYVTPFEQIFKDTYATTHRLDTNRLRNVSKFFAHLLFTDAIGWEVLEIMKLNEEDTTSSSRIFIKILFQELAEYIGLAKLNARLKDVTLHNHFAGLFPRDNPKNTRFAINFFTSIGLGGLTDELREHLKSLPKLPAITNVEESSSSDSSDDESSEDSSSSSDSSSKSSDSSDEEKNQKQVQSKRQHNRRGFTSTEEQKVDEHRNLSTSRKSRREDSRERSDKKLRNNRPEKDNHTVNEKHEWGKSCHDDNLTQLRSEKEIFESSRKSRRSRSRGRQKSGRDDRHNERHNKGKSKDETVRNRRRS